MGYRELETCSEPRRGWPSRQPGGSGSGTRSASGTGASLWRLAADLVAVPNEACLCFLSKLRMSMVDGVSEDVLYRKLLLVLLGINQARHDVAVQMGTTLGDWIERPGRLRLLVDLHPLQRTRVIEWGGIHHLTRLESFMP